MRKALQGFLLIVGVIALIALVIEISLSVGATMHGNTPAKVEHVTAGPYHLKVSLYKYPANAGFALPFAIAPEQPTGGTLTYDVTSLPGEGLHATAVHGSVSPDPNTANGVQGTAEITVQGQWELDIIVNGSAGQDEALVPQGFPILEKGMKKKSFPCRIRKISRFPRRTLYGLYNIADPTPSFHRSGKLSHGFPV